MTTEIRFFGLCFPVSSLLFSQLSFTLLQLALAALVFQQRQSQFLPTSPYQFVDWRSFEHYPLWHWHAIRKHVHVKTLQIP